MTLTAKEKMANLLAKHGWVKDPTVTVRSWSSSDHDYVDRPDPWAYVRDEYHLKLEYSDRHRSHNRLEGAKLDDRSFATKSTRLWDVTGRAADGETLYHPKTGRERSLRERVEIAVRAPDLTTWLAAEARFADDEENRKKKAAQAEDQRLRSRPLPVSVAQQRTRDWRKDSEWDTLVRQLNETVDSIEEADGKSDLHKLVSQAEQRLQAIRDVLVGTTESIAELRETARVMLAPDQVNPALAAWMAEGGRQLEQCFQRRDDHHDENTSPQHTTT